MLLNCVHVTHLVKLYLGSVPGEAKCYAKEHWRGVWRPEFRPFLRSPY